MKAINKTLIGLLVSCFATCSLFAQNEGELEKSIQMTVEEALKEAQEEIEKAKKEIEQSRIELQKQKEAALTEEDKKAIEAEEKALEQAAKALGQTNLVMGGNYKVKEDESKTKIKIGNSKIVISKDSADVEDKKEKAEKEEGRNKFWAGIDYGIAGYLTPKNSLGVPKTHSFLELDYARSRHVSFNFLEKDFRIVKEYVKISTGLGLQDISYAFKSDFVLDPKADEVSANTELNTNFNKNKLNSTWINIPLIFGFSTHEQRDKAFHFSVGAVGGYRIASASKRKFEVNGVKHKEKVRSAFNTLPYHYSARASIGYAGLDIYATYALSELFENNEGPALHPFTLGIKILML